MSQQGAGNSCSGEETPSFSEEDARLNSLYTSSDSRDLLEFYDNFRDRDSLISWMKRRPSGRYVIKEVEGRTDIVAVIPTSDAGGKHAAECRDRIFRGMHTIFVDNGGRSDRYFNFARNVNAGIRKALTYNPDWIVYSNDDMYFIDGPEVLREGLGKLDPSSVRTVFTHPPGSYHSHPLSIAERGFLFNILSYAASRFGRGYYLSEMRLLSRYKNRYFVRPVRPSLKGVLFRNPRKYLVISSFGIFSAKYAASKNGELFDGTYINGFEDIDLSIELTSDRGNYAFVEYRIGDIGGQNLGTSQLRFLRDVVNVTYFNQKVESGLVKLHPNHPL